MTIKYLDLDIPQDIISLEFSLKVIKTLKVTGACFFFNMTSSKIDSSSFTLNDFLLVYLNFILLPYSKRETFFMAMNFAEYRFENNKILLPLT